MGFFRSGSSEPDGDRYVPFREDDPRASGVANDPNIRKWKAFDELKGRSNEIKTSKYTLFTFAPLNLWEQFHKQANLYFLVISCVMYLGEKSTLYVGTIKAWSTAGMLGLMMSVSAFIAAVDDYRRHQSDSEMNARLTTVLKYPAGRAADAAVEKKYKRWDDIQVGDVIEIRNKEELPADIVALSCPSAGGHCFVSTANLDGETNLKPKVACKPEGGLGDFSAFISAEPPQKSIYSFTGAMRVGGASSEEPLGPKNLLLRGTVLRNTEWCRGIVIYTGKDTRVMMNSRAVPIKFSNLEVVINKSMWVAVATQALMAIVVDFGLVAVEKFKWHGYWYLYPDGYEKPLGQLPAPIAFWITFFVLYSNLMPVSLYATMEVCNYFYAKAINTDPDMTDEDGLKATARATNLCNELGQVSHMFSDKTGTLTKNIMELKQIFVGKKVYGKVSNAKGFVGADEVIQDAKNSQLLKDFRNVLCLAHTVNINMEGQLEAESPDEEALVSTAEQFGMAFTGRSGDMIYAERREGGRVEKLSFKVLAVNEFTSTRKRMSIIVEIGGKKVLLAKGADNVMLGLAAKTTSVAEVEASITQFSKTGLRTLVIAKRDLSTFREWKSWHENYLSACGAIHNRESQLQAVAAEIERELEVLGATAIEDKLQEDVAPTIEAIRKAGVKFWMLTGDKLETAKSIGYSTSTLDDGLELMTLQKASDLTELREKWSTWKRTGNRKPLALMVTGKALEELTDKDLTRTDFLPLANDCKVVIACRVSPLQKAEMVSLVRKNVTVSGITPAPVTLAIGDGANDVPMIQEAQVGVGIYGREGRQAVNSSDFAIPQFKHLQQLLLVHGRWNYRRSCKFTLFTFWRNAVQVLLMYYYTIQSGYSGTALFEDNLRITFNGICSIPIIATGIFDQDVRRRQALENPELYEVGRAGLDLTRGTMAGTMISAVAHSQIIWIVLKWAYPNMNALGIGDYWSFGTASYTLLVLGMNYRVAFLTCTWNSYVTASFLVATAMYLMFLVVYSFFFRHAKPGTYQVPGHLADTSIFWICILIALSLQLAFDLFVWFWSYRTALQNQDSIEAKIQECNADATVETREEQERYPAEQPSIQWFWTPVKAKQALLVIGIVLFGFGALLNMAAAAAKDLPIEYSSNKTACKLGAHCTVETKAPFDMEPPVRIYYAMEPYYQNYNGYFLPVTSMANSVFNDTFAIEGHTFTTAGAAWASDLTNLKVCGLDEGKTGDDLERLAVWMRPAALPQLRKTYGYLETPLKAGDILKVNISVNYPVASISARKWFGFETTNSLGGSDSGLGKLLILASVACWILALLIAMHVHASEQRNLSHLSERLLPF